MKILISNLNIPIIHYVAQCLETIKDDNLNIFLWNPQIKSIIDAFDEINPHVVLLHDSQLDQSFNVICNEFDYKYILMCTKDLDTNLPKAPEAIIPMINPQNIFQHYKNKIINVRPVAKIPEIHNAQYTEYMKSDILIDTTHANIDNNIHELLDYLTNTYTTKIIGNNTVQFKQYLGKVSMAERANFIKSANYFIDIGIVGDCWDAAYLKVPALSIYPTNGVVLQFNNLTTFNTHLNTLRNNTPVRKEYIKQCYTNVCDNNTSYHFSAELFSMINEVEIANRLLKYMKGLEC